MKKIIRLTTFLFVLIVCLSAFACSTTDLPKTATPTKTLNYLLTPNNANMYNSDSAVNIRLVPVAMTINKDDSGSITYKVCQYTASGANLENEAKISAVEKMVDNFNKAIYTEKTYDEGYKFFYQLKGDNKIEKDASSNADVLISTIRFFDYKKVTDKISVSTLEVAITSGTATDFVIFRNARTDKLENISKYDASQKQSLKVYTLASNFFSTAFGDVESFELTLPYAPLSYFNGTYKNSLSNDESYTRPIEGTSITLLSTSQSYVVFNDQYSELPMLFYIVGGIIILALLALIVWRIIKLYKGKKSNEKI